MGEARALEGAAADPLALEPARIGHAYHTIVTALAAENVGVAEVLDRIDEILPPGMNVNPADGGWPNPGLEPAARRLPLTLV